MKILLLMDGFLILELQTLLFYPDVVGVLVGYCAGVPLRVSWETASHYDIFFDKWHRRILYRLAMKYVSTIVAVSGGTKLSLISRNHISEHKVRIVRYGVDLKKYHKKQSDDMRQAMGLQGAFPVLGVVARLDYIKGHSFLIQAVSDIVKKYPKLRCVLVGEGDYRTKLEKLIHELGLTDHFVLLGTRSDIVDILSVLDLFILPSISEGLPNVILEAMACSVPVVASRVGGIPEIIEHRISGLLVPAQNTHALSKSILELFDNGRLRRQLGENARKRVQEKFSLEHQIRQFKKIYHDFLSI